MRIVCLIVSLFASVAWGQVNNGLRVNQYDSGVPSFFGRDIPPPAGAGLSVLVLNPTTQRPELASAGSGLSYASGVLSAGGGSPTWASITGTPTTLSGYGITDAYPLTGNPSAFLTSITSGNVTGALGFTPYDATNPSAYISRTGISLTTTGTGAASYNSTTGALNVPNTTYSPPVFNFGFPAARTLAVSTSYQAVDNTKSAIIIPSYACQNATQILAASGCTIQVRMHTSAVTCSTGTVYYTQSLTVNLGLLLTQNSTNPVQINLPPGAFFIMCPTAGTFTITAVEQASG